MDQENCMTRVTRAAKRRAVELMAESLQRATKKRVVLGEITSNILGNPNLNPCSEPQRRGRPRKVSKPVVAPLRTPPPEKTPAEDVVGLGIVSRDDADGDSDDPEMCGAYVASIYDYLRNMEVRLSKSVFALIGCFCFC